MISSSVRGFKKIINILEEFGMPFVIYQYQIFEKQAFKFIFLPKIKPLVETEQY